MKYLVTGATGFIGSHLVRRLVEDGHNVTALVRNPDKAKVLPDGTHLLRGDLSLFNNEDLELPQCDVVVHLAGVVAADSPEQYETINFRAVQDLLGCLSRQSWRPKRFLFASSLAAAGPSADDRPWTEADALAPIEPYGDAKARAEAEVARAEFPTTSFRPPLVFGPRDPATLTLYLAAERGVGMRVTGEPQRLSYVDVRDLIDAIVLMANDTRPGHLTYFASHPVEMNFKVLWNALRRAVGRKVFVVPIPRWLLYVAMLVSTAGSKVFRYRNQLDAKQYRLMTASAFVCSSQALQRELGWQPNHDIFSATRNAVQGYRAGGLLK